MGAMPMVGGVYPNNNYTPEAYEDLLWTEKEISKLGVSVFPFLNATDDGYVYFFLKHWLTILEKDTGKKGCTSMQVTQTMRATNRCLKPSI